ncbi:DUF7713 domain-containing protein [Alkalihalophilus pseudofirmus]
MRREFIVWSYGCYIWEAYIWDELGQMVKSFEGFQVQMKFFDMTDDID